MFGWYADQTAESEDMAVTSETHIHTVCTEADSTPETKKAGVMYMDENTGACADALFLATAAKARWRLRRLTQTF